MAKRLEPPRELLRGLLGVEFGELRVLLRKERAGLQLEQRRHEHEELAARVEIASFAFRQPFDEANDDLGHVHLAQLELLLEHERQQQVERPLERVEVQLELAHDHRRQPSRATGRGPSVRPSRAPAAARHGPDEARPPPARPG